MSEQEATPAVTCPACGSVKVEILCLKSDGVLLEACKACGAFWEAELRDCPASQPCDNCAWRPGSPERTDPVQWKTLMESFQRGATFYCHKRVPARLDGAKMEFDFKIEQQEGRFVCSNAPVCAGWLAWKLGQIYRGTAKKAQEGQAE